MALFCRECGKENPDGSKFCESCGTAFAKTNPPAPAAGSPRPMSAAGGGGPLIGRVLEGNYRIDALIGSGGMATVYRGTHAKLGHPLAIKVMAPNLATDEALVERFRQEARLQARLRHPNIVAVHDLVVEAEVVAFVMELVEGRTLEEVIRRETGPLPLPRCRALFVPVLQAVAFAHEQGVVHRDLKPSNVLIATVGGEEVVKVTDFGIAKALGGARRTATGMKMGTLHYMSPEQCRGAKDVDHRADVYSLGVTLYEMATGRVPFDRESEYDLMTAHLGEPPPSPRTIYPGVSPAFEAVILKALAKSPDERYGTAREFHAALVAIAKGAPVRAVPAAQPARAVSAAVVPAAPTAAPSAQAGPAVAVRPAPAAPTVVEQPAPRPSRPAAEDAVGPRTSRDSLGEAAAAEAPPGGSARVGGRVSAGRSRIAWAIAGAVAIVAAAVLLFRSGSSGGGESRRCDGFYDPATRLCWQNPAASGACTWQQAMDYCAGRGRLPTKDELSSLLRSPGADGCRWPEGLQGTCGWYWSSSSYAGSASNAWLVYFNVGYVDYYGKSNTNYVRCVRRGP